MTSRYLNQITAILDHKNLPYKLLDDLVVGDFEDYSSCYLLINDRILYVFFTGEPDSYQPKLLRANLLQVGESNSKQNLTLVLDVTQLKMSVASAYKESSFFDAAVEKYWSKLIGVYHGNTEDVMDMFQMNKPNDIKRMEFLTSPKLAIENALGSGKSEMASDEYLNSLSKTELIEELKRTRQQTLIKNNKSIVSLLNAKLAEVNWKEEDSKLIEFDHDDVLSSVLGLYNSILRDYKDLHKEHQKLNGEFYKELQFQVGEVMHQEASLRSIFDSLDSIVWMVDDQFNLLAFNKNFYHHVKSEYGIIPVVGMNVLEQTELAGSYKKTIDRIYVALNGKEENYRDFYKKDGEIVKVVDSKVFPVMLSKEISGVACLSNDITESYEVKEKVKNNERIIASVNKNISEAIYRTSHEKGLIFINDAFVRMFGFETKEELYNHVALNSIYAVPEDRAKLGKLLIEKKEVTNMEVQFRKKCGEVFTGLLSSMVSEDENGLKYFDGAIRDVSAIKSAQERLKKQNRELKKLNTELDSFVYSASHDLKAPLSSVKGLINLAKNENDKDKLTEYLDLVDKSINKLDDFIKDIIDLSRNARQEVMAEQIDFQELIDDTLDNYQYLEDFDKISKRIEIENDIKFYSDKRRLKVIFNNLISNAIRYFNPFIDDPYVQIKVEMEAENVLIIISDNGLGIQEQYLDKIFEMFFRASNNSKGTGIGLYIVKETIQKVKGKISVESEVQKGTRFIVTVPNLKN